MTVTHEGVDAHFSLASYGATRPRGGIELSAWCAPAAEEPDSGDWCDAFYVSEHLLAVSVGDACGHGHAASPERNAIRAALDAALRASSDPVRALVHANRIAMNRAAGTLVTALVGFLDTVEHTFAFANAGHPPPLLVGPAGDLFLERTIGDLPLGIGHAYAAEPYLVPVPPDRLIVLYTDGLTEHERDTLRGEKELRAAAAVAYRLPRHNAARTIAGRLLGQACGPDDVGILAIRVLP
jgi:serine phosphatase RsbU (regulator of sigma subunit)